MDGFPKNQRRWAMDPVSFTLLHGNESQRFSLRPGEDRKWFVFWKIFTGNQSDFPTKYRVFRWKCSLKPIYWDWDLIWLIWLIWLKYEPYLVGGLEPWNFMTFHGNSNPNRRNPSFFRGVGTPPTRIWLKHEPYIGWHNVEIGLKDSHHYVQNVARMTAWPLVAIRTVICLWTCLRLSSCCFSGLPIFFV